MTMELKAAAPTDFWRKPPNLDVSSAPTSLKVIHSSKFHKARVTVSANWSRLYDQGGLFITFPSNPDLGKGPIGPSNSFWLKSGIEMYNDRPNLSTVAAREWADWSLLPLEGKSVTIEIEREKVDPSIGLGSSLWVYLVAEGGKRTAVREVTWAFQFEGEMQVGVYAARPTKIEGDSGEELVVEFTDYELVAE